VFNISNIIKLVNSNILYHNFAVGNVQRPISERSCVSLGDFSLFSKVKISLIIPATAIKTATVFSFFSFQGLSTSSSSQLFAQLGRMLVVDYPCCRRCFFYFTNYLGGQL